MAKVDRIVGRIVVRLARRHGRTVTAAHLRETERLARLFEADGADQWSAAERAAVLALRLYAIENARGDEVIGGLRARRRGRVHALA